MDWPAGPVGEHLADPARRLSRRKLAGQALVGDGPVQVHADVADVFRAQRRVLGERHADQLPELVPGLGERRDVDVVADPVAFEEGDGLAGGQVLQRDGRADVGGHGGGEGEVRHLDLHRVTASGRVHLELAELGVHVRPLVIPGGVLDAVPLALEGVSDDRGGAGHVPRLADEQVDVLGTPGADVVKLERAAPGERDSVFAARGRQCDARDIALPAVEYQALMPPRRAADGAGPGTGLPTPRAWPGSGPGPATLRPAVRRSGSARGRPARTRRPGPTRTGPPCRPGWTGRNGESPLTSRDGRAVPRCPSRARAGHRGSPARPAAGARRGLRLGELSGGGFVRARRPERATTWPLPYGLRPRGGRPDSIRTP